MLKTVLFILCTSLIGAVFVGDAGAQTSRNSVGPREVNGTYRYNFTGQFKRLSSEIKILALGKGKVKLAFELTYPYIDGNGDMSANEGTLEGIADISGDTAIYSSNEFGECRITIKFVKPETINVSEEGGSVCGFGHNVSANGTFRKVCSIKPKFYQFNYQKCPNLNCGHFGYWRNI